jgi:hypothetical protein
VNKKYTIHILTRKVGHWVEVDQQTVFASGTADMIEIDRWVLQHDLGRRQSFSMWSLDSPDAVTAFILKWGH